MFSSTQCHANKFPELMGNNDYTTGKGKGTKSNKKRLHCTSLLGNKIWGGEAQISGLTTTTCIPRVRLVEARLTVCYNPLLPRTTSERENVEITVRAAQAIVTKSVVVIPIYLLSRFWLIINYL